MISTKTYLLSVGVEIEHDVQWNVLCQKLKINSDMGAEVGFEPTTFWL